MSFMGKAISTLLAGSALSLVAGQALAAEVEEIIVTAQKRSERLMDVPLSITAASGEDLQKRGITDTAQLAKLVPGFTYQESAYGTPVFTIRGIGFYDGAFGAGPTVTTYIDQVPLPYSVMTRGATLDLERVEVLKGPQGTLFGQNSTGGAINYIAAKPTSEFSAGLTASYGRFNATDIEGFLSGPLTSKLRARVALRAENADGWQKSITRPDDRFGEKEFYNGRVLLDWTPTDALSFELNVSGWQDNSQIPNGQFQQFAPQVPVPNPLTQFVFDAMSAAPVRLGDARTADWTPGTTNKTNRFFLISLRGDWALTDNITLTSITAYSDLAASQPYDADGVAFQNFSNTVRHGVLTSVSEELRLSGTMKRLKWMVGGNYQRDVANEASEIRNDASNGALPVPGPFGPFGPPSFVYQDRTAYFWNQQPTTHAVFGSIDYELIDQLTFQLSARYTEHRRHFNGCIKDAGPGYVGVSAAEAFLGLSELLTGTPSTIGPNACLTLNDDTLKPEWTFKELSEHNLSWRTGLTWKPTENSLIYVNASKGYKAGTFEPAPGIRASEFDPIPQESVLAFEGGVKYSFNRRVEISTAVFHYNYSNKQLIGVANYPVFGFLPKLVNIPKSRVWGAEFQVTVQPLEHLRVQAGVSYVNSRVITGPPIPLDPLGNIIPYEGQSFPNTPNWQVVADAEYSIPFSVAAQAFIGGSLSYRSKSNAAFGNNQGFVLPSYTLIDLRAGLEGEKWRAQIWGHNVTNEYYWVNVSRLLDAVVRNAAMPVTYGITLSYRY